MEPAWKLKLDSDEVIMADDTTRDLSSLMSKIKQTTEFQKQHSNTSNTEDNNDVSDTRVSFQKVRDRLENIIQNTLAVQTVPDLDAIDIKMDENASIETIRPNSPLFDTGRVTFNDSVEMIQAQEAVDDHEDQNLKKEKLLSDEKP